MFEPFRIPYEWRGSILQYVPDFFDINTRTLYEIKSSYHLAHEKTQAKLVAGDEYCNQKGYTFTVLTEVDLQQLGIPILGLKAMSKNIDIKIARKKHDKQT